MKGKKPRVRLRLLLLLWVWAACVFVTLDLFLNVRELDDVRPRASLYRGMRVAAHKLVGEPVEDAEAPTPQAPPVSRVVPTPSSRTVAFLGEIELRPEAQGAAGLLERRARLPDTPEALNAYARAAAAVVASLHAQGELGPAGRARANELAASALEAQAQALERGPDPSDEDWRSAQITVERIGWVDPGITESDTLERLRGSVDRFLETLPAAAGASNAQVEALRLATLVGDEETAAVCLRLLRSPHRSARTREGYLARAHAMRTVIERGNESQRLELTDWLSTAMAQEQDPAAQERLMGQVQRLMRPRRSAASIRDVVAGSAGR